MEHKTKQCPACGCKDFIHTDEIDKGFRVCKHCGQEWWTDIDYSGRI